MFARATRLMLLMTACLALMTNITRAIDFFDVLPLDEFWKQQEVEVSTKSMTSYLAMTPAGNVSELIEQLGAARFVDREKAFQALKQAGNSILPQLEKAAKESEDVEIRTRLGQLIETVNRRNANLATLQMAAIRTIERRKMKDALPTLRTAVNNSNPIVADYARQAIAALEGKPYNRPEISDALLAQDLALLPYDCGMVAQIRSANLRVGDVFSMIKGLPFGGASGLDRMKREMIQAALRFGNVRVDSMTVGVSDDIGGRGGYGVMVYRGKYSKDAFLRLLREKSRAKEPNKINGIEVWQPDREIALIFPSDDRLIMVAGGRDRYLPLGRVTKALSTKAPKLAINATMRELMTKVDRSKQAWAVAKTNTVLRGQIPPLKPFDWFIGEAHQDTNGALHFRFEGHGPDDKAIAAAIAMTRAELDQAIVEAEKMAATVPLMKSMVNAMKSIKLESKATHAHVTARVDHATTLVLSPMLIYKIERAARVKAMKARDEALKAAHKDDHDHKDGHDHKADDKHDHDHKGDERVLKVKEAGRKAVEAVKEAVERNK